MWCGAEGGRESILSDWWELNERREEGQEECHIRIHDNHENNTHSLH